MFNSHSHYQLPITHAPLRGSEVAHGGDHGRCFKSAEPPNALPPQDRAGSPLPITHFPLPNLYFPPFFKFSAPWVTLAESMRSPC
ncbi:MAG: hypothetical protein KME31_32010 [Tolypothrix carrinoi HA7290-LM1]|nr:hypothetical protein [Tolypothrix carrinoi HA7290-LM1]